MDSRKTIYNYVPPEGEKARYVDSKENAIQILAVNSFNVNVCSMYSKTERLKYSKFLFSVQSKRLYQYVLKNFY